jgi:hypothetical protein
MSRVGLGRIWVQAAKAIEAMVTISAAKLTHDRSKNDILFDHRQVRTVMATTARRSTTRSLAAALALMHCGTAAAQSTDEFYKGKTINLIIGAGPGGGIDLYGRLVALHLGRHLPGKPKVVPQNMPAAGSIAAAN